MLDIVLYRPQIPPNTGSIMRLAANTGARLHLVGPIAFDLSDAALRRAGLDYRDTAQVSLHADWAAAREALAGSRWFAIDVSGGRRHDEAAYRAGDVLLFGQERHGLPPEVLDEVGRGNALRLPMVAGSRSLNLSNAAAVVVYEAWRQIGYPGAGGSEARTLRTN